MKELINIFQKNKSNILDQLLETINKQKLSDVSSGNLDEAFLYFGALDTIYSVDQNFIQLSPIFHRNSSNGELTEKKVKKTLKENIDLKENDYYISSPYVSTKTNEYVITLVKKVDDRLIALDFNLFKLLEEFKHASIFSKIFLTSVKIVYGIIGVSLSLFALILVFYALYDFMSNLYFESTNIFSSIFRSTIALTLGLAIFDLSKNLLEYEVIFKEHTGEDHGGNKLLIKFMVSIIIALAIEALMMVFKIAISDYKDILYAVYLLLAIGFLLITLSQFNKYMAIGKNNDLE